MKFQLFLVASLYVINVAAATHKEFDNMISNMIDSLEKTKREVDMKINILRTVSDSENSFTDVKKRDEKDDDTDVSNKKESHSEDDEKANDVDKETVKVNSDAEKKEKEIRKEASKNVLSKVLSSMIEDMPSSHPSDTDKRESKNGDQNGDSVSNEETEKRFLRKFFQKKKKPVSWSSPQNSEVEKNEIEEDRPRSSSSRAYHGKKSIEEEIKRDSEATDKALDNVLSKLNNMLDKRIEGTTKKAQ